MDIEIGNAGAVDTSGTGWIIGFSEWTKSTSEPSANLRYMAQDALAQTLHMKWMEHPANDDRGTHKPPSEGRTVSILVSETGCFRIQFAPTAAFANEQVVEARLSKHGDFAIWGENIHHRWFVDDRATILTLRWIPVPTEVHAPAIPTRSASER